MSASKKFKISGLTTENFSSHLKRIVVQYNITYIEALNEVIEDNNIEIEDVLNSLDDETMFFIRQEAESKNLIRNTSGDNVLL